MQQQRDSPAPMGSRLLGGPDETSRRTRIRVQLLLTATILVTNVIGALIAVLLITVVIPGPTILTMDYVYVNFIAVPVYVVFAIVVGLTWGTRSLVRDLRWATTGRTPSAHEQRAAFRAPLRLALMQGAMWGLALVLLTTLYAFVDVELVPKIAFTIALTGITICAFCYLLSQFALRPVAARALEYGPLPERALGITSRTMLTWLLGTGVPILGLMLIAVFSFIRPASSTSLAVAILAVGGVALVVGPLLALLSVRATAAPIRSVRTGMSRVAEGDLDASVVVYDGTELGALQIGFNRMAEGLRERERIRDLFGRHVGHDVAANALTRRSELGGEERHVAVLFVDIIGSTTIAATHDPVEVVEILNRFFGVVVDEVDSRGGFVNKFEGDAALAIFGAPTELSDPAGRALATARAIHERLASEVSECDAGLGVAAGPAVAGNIGARERFEYTVIGDPVNEAARLSELAKTVPGHVVASGRALEAADSTESRRWSHVDDVVLRGRIEPTRITVPADTTTDTGRRPDQG
ncbi:MAG: HAMP domain-containing protein [Rhodococcus sp.]|nr:HAMP domain-containing protein [Rhodococcus sp. (in: high G+C Gram-positive bacteria)]